MQKSVPQGQYVTLWEFHVLPGFEEQFERVYGSGGDWAQLFRKGEGYIRTELYRDLKNRRRYVTVDVWESELSHREFLEGHADEYRAMDKRCEEMTKEETPLGQYETVTTESDT